MKRSLMLLFALNFFICSHAQVVADHTVVDHYNDIPQRWIDSVKTKLVWVIGMSHGNAYFRGAELLEQLDPKFQLDIWYHVDPPAEQSNALRLGRPRWGRESFWTSQDGIDKFNESTVATQNETGNQYDYICFGWSYQSVWENDLGGGLDPVYQVHWAGSTQFGPDGNKRWGLDSDDSILTENRVCMDTYLDAVEQYNQYYKDQNYETTFFFSNGIVDDDGGTELGFQRELKNQHVRDYVNARNDAETYFFDYADILVHNDDGELHTEDWDDGGTLRPHQQIHPDNDMDYDEDFQIIPPGDDENEDHIGEVGALRLAKAFWWLLARASGWDGNTTSSSENEGLVPSKQDIFVYADANSIRVNNIQDFVEGHIRLYDLNGKQVRAQVVHEDQCSFSTSSLPSGMYLVVISKDHEYHSEKVVVLP